MENHINDVILVLLVVGWLPVSDLQALQVFRAYFNTFRELVTVVKCASHTRPPGLDSQVAIPNVADLIGVVYCGSHDYF